MGGGGGVVQMLKVVEQADFLFGVGNEAHVSLDII